MSISNIICCIISVVLAILAVICSRSVVQDRIDEAYRSGYMQACDDMQVAIMNQNLVLDTLFKVGK